MSTKRKSTTVPELSPKPKRRVSTAVRKRGRDGSDEEQEAPVKVSRKKATAAAVVAPSDDESTSKAVPTPRKSRAKPVPMQVPVEESAPSSPAKSPRGSRNSLSSSYWIESIQVSPVAASRKPTAQTSKVVEASPQKTTSSSAPVFSSPASSYLPPPVAASPAPAAVSSRWSAVEVTVDDDDSEIGFWKQASHSLVTSMAVITPVFVTMIIASYVVATLLTDHSVAIASMGITFSLLLVLILTSFSVAVLPSIYLSRLFTALVMTPSDCNATKWPWQWKRNLNFYSTFTALSVLAVISLVVVFNV